MSSTIPSLNPFIHGSPPKDESPLERARRKQEEAQAKAISDAIDKQIEQDRIALKTHKRAIKVLLLGQSGSGKSTIVKNFQLRYAHSALVREQSSWKIAIYLNLVRSVTMILDIVDEAMKEQHDRLTDQRRSTSPSRSYQNGIASPPSDNLGLPGGGARDSVFDFSEKHKLLQLRLQPLTRVQSDLERHLSSAFQPEYVGRTVNTAFPCLAAESPKLSRHHTKFSEEIHDTTEILYSCVSDIKQLCADDIVQQVLKGTKPPLERFSRSFMEDIDRLMSRDYKPSDEDIVKARVRTTGVQEHHFRINRGQGDEDWILHDVGGSWAPQSTWRPYYFDDIDSIIFLAPMDCFDQRSEENPTVNRLENTIISWKHICNCKLLTNVQLILLLTKVDLLKEKLESGVRFDKYVLSYGGRANDVLSITSYLRRHFKTILQKSGSQRVFHCYLTSAIDTNVVHTIQSAVLRDAKTL
ncbi:P-loop containing nucleoside triphosphate hydrolase protein [Thelephora ganbajun]|uniref:P-loop containing nucleoside triphosphate hydrolase protein n=1 Tax=Thelephora ganbajun TaxID=370292 RepID=A0ACB6ZG99_THEGA|nr:P-loop containing nucleoside triphosphate hydrolase protein [Thelephora ganbajun]